MGKNSCNDTDIPSINDLKTSDVLLQNIVLCVIRLSVFFFNCFQTMEPYKCNYCTEKFNSFEYTVQHCIDLHSDKELIIQKLLSAINPNDAGPSYRKLSFSNTSTAMKYNETVKKFWWAGAKLFHGKFLRFMGGPKNIGQIVDGIAEHGRLETSKSQINFVVPSKDTLQTKSIIKNEIQPGIIQECIDAVAENTTDIKFSFDGKKINSCLTENQGDVDLFQCEPSPALAEKKERLETELKMVDSIIETLDKVYPEQQSLDLADDDKR